MKTKRFNEKVAKAKKFVKNLSAHSLTDNETLLLARGIKYIINPTNRNAQTAIMNDFMEFQRKIRLLYLHKDKEEYKLHPFYKNTGFKPHYSCPTVENYLFATRMEISKINISKHKSNISYGERTAIKINKL